MSVDPEGSQLPEDGMNRRDFAAYVRRLARIEVERIPGLAIDGTASIIDRDDLAMVSYIEGRVSALLAMAERIQAGQVDPEEEHPALPMVPRDFSEYIHGK